MAKGSVLLTPNRFGVSAPPEASCMLACAWCNGSSVTRWFALYDGAKVPDVACKHTTRVEREEEKEEE